MDNPVYKTTATLISVGDNEYGQPRLELMRMDMHVFEVYCDRETAKAFFPHLYKEVEITIEVK